MLPKEIAENYRLQVFFANFGMYNEVSGFLDYANRSIIVNVSDAATRKTFTIAHELGHFILHKKLFEEHPEDYTVLMRSPMGAVKDPLENEANSFAANLLVPKVFLNKYKDIASISELAKLFIVSEEVIRWRMKFEYDLAA